MVGTHVLALDKTLTVLSRMSLQSNEPEAN